MDNIYNVLDVALYGLMFLDFIIKYVKLHSNIKSLSKTKRYHKPYSKLKLMLVIIFLVCNVFYIVFRLVQISNHQYHFMVGALILPVICYYLIYDLLFGGIYYSAKGIYVKSTLIRFSEFNKCYRHYNEEAKGYGYMVYYSPNFQGNAEIDFFVDNIPEAFELMTRIPVSNEE